jgi:hypothetical protein
MKPSMIGLLEQRNKNSEVQSVLRFKIIFR